jgi:very-short-patch-repair endonuclease
MTKLYNRASEKGKRQQLRRDMTKAEFMLWQKLKGKQLEGVKFRSFVVTSTFLSNHVDCLGSQIDRATHQT